MTIYDLVKECEERKIDIKEAKIKVFSGFDPDFGDKIYTENPNYEVENKTVYFG